MGVQLLAIQFNHDSGAATHDALNLRRNATEFVQVPEWRRGATAAPQDSPAAYAVAQVRGHDVRILAKFRTNDPTVTSAQIRALDADIHPPGATGCMGWLASGLRALFRALFGNVLGEAGATTVTFGAGGETGWETFFLRDTRLDWAAVGAYTTTWRWQYRLNEHEPWQDFDLSTHRIYVLLDLPSAPWQQTPHSPANTQLPWTEVLDHACLWARGAHTAEAAARAVTRGVNGLGPSVVAYDCPNGGATHYASPVFNCTAFLERLRGGPGNGYYVNCTDCATFTSTFANALGCDLWQSRMGWGFALNPLRAIGSSVWQPACGWVSFNYHEVAWTGACTVDDAVYDACLEVDVDVDPTVSPHTPELPCEMRFGNAGEGDYRDRLATPAGSPNCNAQPATRQRRPVI